MVNGEGNLINCTLTWKSMLKALWNKALNHITVVAFFINTLDFKEVVSTVETEELPSNLRLF